MVAEGTRRDRADADDQRATGSPTGSPAPRNGRGDAAWRFLAAAGSGVAQLLALPPYGLWWLAPLSAALLALAVFTTRMRRAAWLGAVAGAALMVPLVRWQQVFGTDVWLVIAAAETVYFVPMAMGVAWVTRLRGWPVWTAALWVLQEAVRARFPLGGFPWGKLAFAQPDTPFAGYAAWGSSALVTFAVALAGGLLLAGVLRLATARRVAGARHRATLTAVAALAAAGAVTLAGLLPPTIGAPSEDHRTTVALVQGDVPAPGAVNIAGGRAAQVLNNHVDGVHELARRIRAGEVEQPDLVVLPENASDIDPYADPKAAALITDAARDIDAPLLFGVTKYGAGAGDVRTREIRSVVWDPQDGPGDYYTKRYLVPFGEYIPYRAFFTRFVSRLEQVASDAVPGTEPGALRLGGTTVAAAICFDVAFDRPVREAVAAGGQIIVVPTNNANYNFTGQSDQQLAITRLRAVEHGRPAVVASTSGISAVIRPDGTVSYRSPEAEPALHVTKLSAMSGRTPATRLGALPEAALSAVALGAVLAGIVATRRSRRARPAPAAESPGGEPAP